MEAIGVSGDASGRKRGRRTDKLSQIAGDLATQSEKIERYRRGLFPEDWQLIKSRSGISSSSEPLGCHISLMISVSYKKGVVDDMGLEPTTSALRTRRSPN